MGLRNIQAGPGQRVSDRLQRKAPKTPNKRVIRSDDGDVPDVSDLQDAAGRPKKMAMKRKPDVEMSEGKGNESTDEGEPSEASDSQPSIYSDPDVRSDNNGFVRAALKKGAATKTLPGRGARRSQNVNSGSDVDDSNEDSDENPHQGKQRSASNTDTNAAPRRGRNGQPPPLKKGTGQEESRFDPAVLEQNQNKPGYSKFGHRIIGFWPVGSGNSVLVDADPVYPNILDLAQGSAAGLTRATKNKQDVLNFKEKSMETLRHRLQHSINVNKIVIEAIGTFTQAKTKTKPMIQWYGHLKDKDTVKLYGDWHTMAKLLNRNPSEIFKDFCRKQGVKEGKWPWNVGNPVKGPARYGAESARPVKKPDLTKTVLDFTQMDEDDQSCMINALVPLAKMTPKQQKKAIAKLNKDLGGSGIPNEALRFNRDDDQ